MTQTTRPSRTLPILALALLAGAGLSVAGIYGIGGFQGNAAGALCAATLENARALAPLVRGEVAAMVPAERPVALSQIAFTGADGKPRTLADWRGRIVLLNLWATWCAPCKAEMPDLDRLQARLGSDQFEVVTVNIDTGTPDRRRKFLADAGITALADHTDPTLGIYKALQGVGLSRGMPTTVLVDRDGCELAAMNGPAPWTAPEAAALITAAIGLGRPGATP